VTWGRSKPGVSSELVSNAAARVAAGCLATALLGGCGKAILKHSPGTTYGDITVSSPRVSTRERLVNDRLQQDLWLRRELELADTREFGLQGAADLRTFSGSSTRISGSVDQAEIDRYRLDQAASRDAARRMDEQAELDHQLQRLYKQRQMEALAQTPLSNITAPTAPATKPADTKPPAVPSGPSGPAKGELNVIEEIAKLKEQLGKLTINPSELALPERIRPSPQEVLRDKLEYRGMIRNEIIQNSLDDRHDRKGHTLLRLDMDATVRAENDTSAWAIIDVTINTTNWLTQCTQGELYERWSDETGRELRERSLMIVRQAGIAAERSMGGRLPEPEKTAEERVKKRLQFFAGMVFGLPDYILFEIQRKWMDARGPAIPFVYMPEFFPGDEFALLSELRPGSRSSNYAPAYSILVYKAREAAKSRIAAAASGTAGKELLFSDLMQQLHLGVSGALESLVNKNLSDYVKASVDDKAGILSVNRTGAKQKFCATLNEAIDLFAYGSTPVETVQRIGEVASYRQVNQFLLALNFLVGNTAAGKWFQEFAKVNEGIFQTIRRQPLVVGYSTGVDHKNPTGGSRSLNFGWILGPRFTIKDDGLESHFRHGTTPAALSGVIALPGWMDGATLSVRRRWVSESGKDGKVLEPEITTLPIKVKEDFYSITEALSKYSIRGPRPEARQQLVFNEGEAGSILIPGQNMWRNPVVLIGAQKADDVLVLPDMRGLLATFKDVKLPAGNRESVPVVVWTSEGHTEVAQAKIISTKKATVAPQTTVESRQIISGEFFEAKLAPPLASYSSLDVLVSAGRQEGQIKASDTVVLDEGRTVKFKPPLIPNADSGSKATLQLNVKTRPDQPAPEPYGPAVSGVYYKTAGDAKLKIEPASQTVKKLGKFTLTFAPGSAEAFPGFDKAAVQVAFERTADDAPVPVVELCERGKDGKTCTFSISGVGGLKAEATYKVKVTAAGHTLPNATETIKITP
jgi:hypothetical protein